MKPAVFFDRDNTLIIGDEYLSEPDKVVLMPNAVTCIARLQAAGFLIVTVSNQSGVARGYFTDADVRAVDARMDEMLRDADSGATIDAHYFCPHLTDISGPCACRKPLPGMLIEAAKDLAIDLPRSFLVGDAPRDVEAGHAAGCRTVLFSPQGVPPSQAALVKEKVAPDHRTTDLADAADWIVRQISVAGEPERG